MTSFVRPIDDEEEGREPWERRFSALDGEHWLVTSGVACAVCGQPFKVGQHPTLRVLGPADGEGRRAAEGRAHTAKAEPIHWDCR